MIDQKPNLFKTDGFSLVEAIVALGLMAILGLMMGYFFQNQEKHSKYLYNKGNFEQLRNSVQSASASRSALRSTIFDLQNHVTGSGVLFPKFEGCAPLNLIEYNNPAYTNCSYTEADPCTEGAEIDYIIKFGGTNNLNGFYKLDGIRCNVLVATTDCPVQIRTYFVPHCAQKCGVTSKCKKVDYLEMHFLIKQIIPINGQISFKEHKTGLNGLPPTVFEMSDLLQ